MKRYLPFVLCLLLTALSSSIGLAQIPIPLTAYLAMDGLSTAQQTAKDSLPSDAVLIYIGTLGKFDTTTSIGDVSSRFNLDNGKANFWGYTYYSASQDMEMTIAVAKVLVSWQSLIIPNFSVPGPIINAEVPLTGTYANSDKLIAQLKKDTTYQRFRSELKDMLPYFVASGINIPYNPVPTPNDLNDEPQWTISFVGGRDSTMTCYVGLMSGKTICKRISIPSSAPESFSATHGIADVSVTPNPATGVARINVTVADGMRSTGAVIALFDERGEKVMDLSEQFARNNFRYVEFDAHALSAGTYYCRAIGDNWSGVTGIVVE